MAEANSQLAIQNSEFLTLSEQYHCPRCHGAIAGECVQGNMVKDAADGRLRRIVKVWCDHCLELFSASFNVIDGRLVIERGPQVVTHAGAREGFVRRLSTLRGDRTQHSVPVRRDTQHSKKARRPS